MQNYNPVTRLIIQYTFYTVLLSTKFIVNVIYIHTQFLYQRTVFWRVSLTGEHKKKPIWLPFCNT